MLSFIIIGRNEGWKLTKCLKSVLDTIAFNRLYDAEIIYVDSKSTDNSIELAKAFKEVKIFLITGEFNAAIARNVGAKEANGDILFFIDGDMEIEKEFLCHAIINNKLKYDCVTGHLDDYLYDHNDNFLGINTRTYKHKIPEKEQILKTNGGIFLIKKEVWDAVSGMRTKYRKGQDIDLSIRLAKYGIYAIRIPFLITKHHTVEYINEKRMWKDLIHFHIFFPSMMLRDHIMNPIVWVNEISYYYTAFLFLALIISVMISIKWIIIFFAMLYFSFFVRSVVKTTINASISKSKAIYLTERSILKFLNDLLFWVGFLFFHPNAKKIEYTSVN